MGIIKQGILGGFLGKVGGVVGGSFKGIATMRAMPLSVANPRTAAQVQNRSRFTSVTGLATSIGIDFLRKYWNRMAVQMSGYNLFCSTNKDVFNVNGAFMQSELLISAGVIQQPSIVSVTADVSEGTAVVTYDYEITGERLSSDLGAVVICNTAGEAVAVVDDLVISNSPWTITMPAGSMIGGEVLFCYVTCKRADGSKVGGTSYKFFNPVG